MNTSWNQKLGVDIQTPQKVLDFRSELEELYRKYDISISHEDGHGSFILERFDPFNLEWINEAFLNM